MEAICVMCSKEKPLDKMGTLSPVTLGRRGLKQGVCLECQRKEDSKGT